MKLILNYLKPYRSRVTLGVIIKFLGTMMELVLPWNLWRCDVGSFRFFLMGEYRR